MAQKLSVVLTTCDLITDIDYNFNDKTKETCEKDDCQNMGNEDGRCSGRQSDRKHNGSVNLTEENVLDDDAGSPSNGFSPVNFYGSKKQRLTPRIKLFSPNALKILKEERGDLISKCSPGVKRKNKKQSSSSAVKKKRRTSNVGKQCKSSGNKNKSAPKTVENCSPITESESLVTRLLSDDKGGRDKGETKLSESVTNVIEGSSSHGSCLMQMACESEGSTSGSASDKSSPSLVKSVSSNPSEVESACSEASLCSGPGSVTDGLFLRKNGSEYFFINSIDNNTPIEQLGSSEIRKDRSEDIANGVIISRPSSTGHNGGNLTVKTPVSNDFTNDSQSSFSLPSPSTSESDLTLKLSEKDADSSSSKSSPEHQAPITKYFKSLTRPKCRMKLVNNGVSTSAIASTENSPEVKNRLA